MFSDPDGPQHPLGPLLKPGFRHVSVVILSGNFWILLDARRGVPLVEVVCGADFDLAGHYRSEGYAVIETVQGSIPVLSPLMQANCVGLVKALLCLKTPAQTPWQLYRFLTKETKHEINSGIRRSAVAAKG